MESPVALVLLGLIAAATAVQALLLLSLVSRGRELASRLERVEAEIRPRLQRVADVVDDVGQLTGVLRKPLVPLATAVAVWKGLKTGASFYRASSARSWSACHAARPGGER